MGLEPAPQSPGHHRQHRVVHGRPVRGGRHAVQLLQPGRGEGDRPPRIDVPVERRPQPRLRQLPRGGQQRGQPVMRNRPRRPWRPRSPPGGARPGERFLIPQDGAGHVHGRHAVGQGVVDAPDQGAPAAGPPRDQVDPPQRPGAVQMLGEEGRDRGPESGLPRPGRRSLDDMGRHVQLRDRHPPRHAIDLAEPHRQHGRAGQAPGDRGTQRPGIKLAVQQDDLAGVPGHGLVLQREDAQILAGQRPGGRGPAGFGRPSPGIQHHRRTPYAEPRRAHF